MLGAAGQPSHRVGLLTCWSSACSCSDFYTGPTIVEADACQPAPAHLLVQRLQLLRRHHQTVSLWGPCNARLRQPQARPCQLCSTYPLRTACPIGHPKLPSRECRRSADGWCRRWAVTHHVGPQLGLAQSWQGRWWTLAQSLQAEE